MSSLTDQVRLGILGRYVIAPDAGEFVSVFGGGQGGRWAIFEPIETVVVTAASSLPFVSILIIRKVELVSQNYLPEGLGASMEVPRRDMRVLPQKAAGQGHACRFLRCQPPLVFGHMSI